MAKLTTSERFTYLEVVYAPRVDIEVFTCQLLGNGHWLLLTARLTLTLNLLSVFDVRFLARMRQAYGLRL